MTSPATEAAPRPTAERDPELDALRPRALLPAWLTSDPPPTFWWTRFWLLRALAFVQLVAFASLGAQLLPLFGRHGLAPVFLYVRDLRVAEGGRLGALLAQPSVFVLAPGDLTMQLACALGVLLSALVLLGVTNAVVQTLLWATYMSFVHVGQVFYGYGWEMLVLEAGFLSIFLCPVRSLAPFPRGMPTPATLPWLYRWLAFRVMFGAGLIKLRGDPCWRALTCLDTHYETQPNPSPLSFWLHHAPHWTHVAGVVVNHAVELVAPLLIFGPRRVRHPAGIALVLFQVTLIASGNLSFLNWLTIAVCVGCFDDQLLARLVPRGLRGRAARHVEGARGTRGQLVASVVLAAGVGLLSIPVTVNLLAPDQQMNASFEPLELVNTYGAFGAVNRERFEVVIAGTTDDVPSAHTRWREYELPCKPGDPMRRPCLVTPYHYRLDWQLWFAGMSEPTDEPWIVDLVYELLRGNRMVLRLFAKNPFPETPPRWVRVERYRYQFVSVREHRRTGAWWWREDDGPYMPPLSLENEALIRWEETRGVE